MADVSAVGRLLIVVGLVLVGVGGLLVVGGKLPFFSSLGRLPGDLLFRRGGVTVYIPIVTSLLLSVLLTLLVALVFRRS